MIKPVNGHLLIEPLVHEAFIATQKDTYEEIGTILAGSDAILRILESNIGDKVYFDSWMAAKFPKNDTEHYWLVKLDDIRAVESVSE